MLMRNEKVRELGLHTPGGRGLERRGGALAHPGSLPGAWGGGSVGWTELLGKRGEMEPAVGGGELHISWTTVGTYFTCLSETGRSWLALS